MGNQMLENKMVVWPKLDHSYTEMIFLFIYETTRTCSPFGACQNIYPSKPGCFQIVSDSCIFFVQLVLCPVLLKARHNELIHESITLHNYELALTSKAIMRSQLENERSKFFSPTESQLFHLVTASVLPISYTSLPISPQERK